MVSVGCEPLFVLVLGQHQEPVHRQFFRQPAAYYWGVIHQLIQCLENIGGCPWLLTRQIDSIFQRRYGDQLYN